MKCYVNKEYYYSYGDYIQRFGGPGNIIVTSDIKPGETYAVSFGSPTGECGICTLIGLGTGAAATAGGIYGAIALGIPTGGLSLVGAGVVAVLFSTGYFAGKAGSTYAVENFATLFDRDINTIYLTTLTQIQSGEYCSIVRDVKS